MHTTGTHITYLHLCHRKLWLFANGVQMEHTSELVAEGKLIHEQSYPQRAERWRELAVEGIKIDHYDAANGLVREVKKSAKMEEAHVAQLKYYLFVLERNGIKISHGLLEYPKLRQTEEVWLSASDREIIPQWEAKAKAIIEQEYCPPRIDRKFCKRCSYYDFCYAEEAFLANQGTNE